MVEPALSAPCRHLFVPTQRGCRFDYVSGHHSLPNEPSLSQRHVDTYPCRPNAVAGSILSLASIDLGQKVINDRRAKTCLAHSKLSSANLKQSLGCHSLVQLNTAAFINSLRHETRYGSR